MKSPSFLFLVIALPLAAQQPRPGADYPRAAEDRSRILDASSLELSPSTLRRLDSMPPLLRDRDLFGPGVQTAPPPTPPAQPPVAIPAPAPVPAPAPAPGPADAPAADKPKLRLVPEKLTVGEQGKLALLLPDVRLLQSFPQIIEAEGLNIEYEETIPQFYSRGGRELRSVELRYRVEPVAPGTHTIPAQTLSVNGKTVTTDPLEVVVTEGQPLPDAIKPQAQLTVSRTEIWEGEEVGLMVAMLFHQTVQPMGQPLIAIKSDGVAVSRFDRHGRTDFTQLNDQQWSVWRIPSSMVAIKSGELTFGPAEVKIDAAVPTGSTQRDMYGSFPSVRRTLTFQSNTVKIRVKPLPAAGRPADFSGLVGKFQIAARSEGETSGPLRIQLGDPVSFEIAVTGTGNFDAIPAPGLENSEGLRSFKPKVTMENRGYGQEFGQKTFAQIIFPEKPGLSSVVFVLPHFDPSTGKYMTAKSTPVDVLVTGEVAAATPAAPAGASSSDTRDFAAIPGVDTPPEDLKAILPNAVEGGPWYSTTPAMAPVFPWVLHGVPAAAVALLLGAGTVRRLRAWTLAHRPPAHAPRAVTLIAGDLRRDGLSRLQFYGFVSEYAHAWAYWKKRPLPLDDGLTHVLAARDHWLYATNAEPAAAPVPRDEQSQAASLLTSRLSA